MAMPPLRPDIGFCLQTSAAGAPRLHGKWFVNMCTHRMVGMPIAPSGKPVSREQLTQHGMALCQVPLDVGTFRKLKERSDGAKGNSFAIDVVFNPFVVKLFTDDEFCNSTETFRPWLTNVAFNHIEKNLGVKLARGEVKLVKNCRYKDGQGADGRIPRDFVDVVEDDEPPEPPNRAPELSPEPLIEEVAAPTGRKKPAVKKGFFNNSKATLYPEEGSKEGFVHEDAGDPMGWMPKGLRNKAKIVDCNSPEYQETERKKKAAEQHNASASEFNEMLKGDLGGASRRQHMQKYDDEMPDGETDASRKYETDYSRFNKIAELEGAEDEVEQRDWYIDSNGKRQEISKAASSGGYPVAPGDAGAGPPKKTEMKKGFFKDAKGSLYGPEGSAQGNVSGPSMEDMLKSEGSKGAQSDMLKEFGKMLGNETDDPAKQAELQRNLEQLMAYQNKQPGAAGTQDAPKITKPKAAELGPVPGHTITPSEDGTSLVLSVEVPSLMSMEGVGLDVSEKSASIVFPGALSIGTLKTPLPQAVQPTKVKAKFSKKTHRITVTMPLA